MTSFGSRKKVVIDLGEFSNTSPSYLEGLYRKTEKNPLWSGLTDRETGHVDGVHGVKESSVLRLIEGYRCYGHLRAKVNPTRVFEEPTLLGGGGLDELSLERYHLSEMDLDKAFEAGKVLGLGRSRLRDIVARLEQVYCSGIGMELMHCEDVRLREWITSAMERVDFDLEFSDQGKINLLKKINEAQYFEEFLQSRYLGQKRFSLEGLESLIGGLNVLIETGADLGVREFVLGMAHRGRLNVLVNVFQKEYSDIFTEFEGGLFPQGVRGDADVKYHLGQSADLKTRSGKEVHLSMLFNPSHLEAIDAVVEGIVYGKAQKYYKDDKAQIVPLHIHGDAAIAGQGIVYEVLNMAALRGYSNLGSVHIVLNNQIGFTAEAKETRSNRYCTDVAKILGSPVFHVNADDPLSVSYVMKTAMMIRQIFGVHVWVDLIGYRRYGHNETDEPRFTQAKAYEQIDKHPRVQDLFLEKLLSDKVLSETEAQKIATGHQKVLREHLAAFRRQSNPYLSTNTLNRHWLGIRFSKEEDFKRSVSTGVKKARLDRVARALTTLPAGVSVFKKLEKILLGRKKNYFTEKKVDWGMAENLAYGSLLLEGNTVRLSGQDSQRGTFGHRHSVIKDVKTGERYIALNHLSADQHHFHVYNSPLSEYGVLGFEYGYSLSRPRALVIWEAQFGDFANGAQIIIDQFISSAEAKWHRLSCLTLYLPHGYEGQGPEHSSARIERFLTLCANNNMYVTNPTTAANFFHLIRRQLLNPFRIPLVVFTPKSLLRHPGVMSSVGDLVKGRFVEIIEEKVTDPFRLRVVLMCSGKVYYDLEKYRADNLSTSEKKKILFVRFEQIYPMNLETIKNLKQKYKNVKRWIWVQEEPINMGAWTFIKHTLESVLDLSCVSRVESSSPATGLAKMHAINQEKLLQAAFKSVK